MVHLPSDGFPVDLAILIGAFTEILDISKESFVPCPKGIKDPFLTDNFKIKPILG